MAIIRFRTNRVIFTAVTLLITAALLGPSIFIHFPRTCIPYVDPQYQTGKRRSFSSSTRLTASTATNNILSGTTGEDPAAGVNNYDSTLQQDQLQHAPVPAQNKVDSDGEGDFSTSKFLPPKIVILSGERCINPNPQAKCRVLGGISFHNRREYVAHHLGRYDLRDNFTDYFNQVATAYPKGDVTPAWAKMKILKDELNRRLDTAEGEDTVGEHDWIFWIDTDALLVEMDIQLERFIDNRASLIITKDHNGLNAGVFFLKVNEWSRQFINYIDQQIGPDASEQDWMAFMLKSKMVLDPTTSTTKNFQVGGTEREVVKRALVSWDETREEDQVKYLPQCSFNSYWQMKGLYQMYRPGDFAIHWAGHNYELEGGFQDWQMRRYFKLPTFLFSN